MSTPSFGYLLPLAMIIALGAAANANADGPWTAFTEYPCPTRLPALELKFSDPALNDSGEWAPLHRRFPLGSVQFMYGPTLDETLKWSRYDANTLTATWHEWSDSDEKWLGCHYGTVVLVKRRPDEVKQCRTITSKNHLGMTTKSRPHAGKG